jgi:antimicrobial peptide system SdpB family protein
MPRALRRALAATRLAIVPSSPWTNVYGVARSLLALGTLLTLCGNSADLLFRPLGTSISEVASNSVAIKMSYFSIFSEVDISVLKWVAAGLLLPVLVGWRPRVMAVPHWWLTYSLSTSSVIIEGGDQVASILTLLLLPVALTDRRKWVWSEPRFPDRFGQRLFSSLLANSALAAIRVQVAVIYLFSFAAKIQNREWSNGTALYYWLLTPTFGAPEWLRPALTSFLSHGFVAVALTWGVLVLESLLFAGIGMSVRARGVLLWVGLLFHFAIILGHGLFTFFLAMAGAQILYLRSPLQPFRAPSFLASRRKETDLAEGGSQHGKSAEVLVVQ